MFAHKDNLIIFIPISFFRETLKYDENHFLGSVIGSFRVASPAGAQERRCIKFFGE
jgi:hypothetical protein